MRSDRSVTGRLAGRFGVAALLALVPVASSHAAERSVADRIASIEADTKSADAQITDIKRNFTERSGLIGATDARARYEEGVYLYLVGDYANAASSFFILVQSRALMTPDLETDSEWYLAECLFELSDYRTAIEAYQAIVTAGPAHPYFADAVRRTLETDALLGDNAAFDKVYSDYIESGKVKSTDLISYTLAKSFYRRGESGRAKAMFESIGAGSQYYSRARYFLGVQMIQEKNYTQAITEFANAEKDPVTDDDHRRVHELSETALARLNYENGDMTEALFWYGKISRNSPVYADQLYESAWADIKNAESIEAAETESYVEAGGESDTKPPANQKVIDGWRAASTQVALFLEEFPQHRYTASMKILQGHLHMKLADWDGAEQSYEKVVAEYDPVVERLGQIQTDSAATGRFLDQLTDDRKGATEDLLPGYAEEILLSRPEVNRAAAQWNTLRQQREELKQSDELIVLLQDALSDNTRRLGTFVTASSQLGALSTTVLALEGRLLDAEILALKGGDSARRPDLAVLQKEKENAYPAAAESRDINAAVAATYAGLHKQLAQFHGEVADPAQLQTIDRQWTTVLALNDAIASTGGVLSASEARELDAVRKKLDVTRARVTELHTDVAAQSTNVEILSEAAIRSGVHAVESDFRTGVLSADKGIVDVAWMRKATTSEQMETLTKEQVALLKSIKEQYDQLRTNASDGETTK